MEGTEEEEREEQRLLDLCIQQQISELMLLKSMYKVPEELQLATVDGHWHQLADNVLLSQSVHEFSLKLKDPVTNTPVELTIRFPSHYPHSDPLSIYIRSSTLDGQSSRQLNCGVRRHLTDTFVCGQPRVVDAIGWLWDHLEEYQSPSRSSNAGSSVACAERSDRFERLWLYSHHIYSKFKRKDIVALANQLNLTGFSMPGKPGVVCVEGCQENCGRFWDTLRTWSWKKIAVRHRETYELNGKKMSEVRKFEQLKEIGFDVRQGGGREFHMDMAGFNKYLIDHQCAYAFSLLFGLDGASGSG